MVDGEAPGWWVGADRCAQCHAPAVTADLCARCTESLTWNQPACWRCAEPTPEAANHPCPNCLRKPPPWHGAWCALRFEGRVVEWIHALKYRADLVMARRLALLLAQHLQRAHAPLPEWVIPMPLYPGRMRQRGFNQAQALAGPLAQQLHLRVQSGAVRRVRDTADQTELSRHERRRNLRGAFAANPVPLAGRHVAIVDDVLTTGASCGALADSLRDAGAQRIDVWCIARTP